jgi:hypothetical protein
LALTNPAVTGEKGADGLLTMEEILALKMNADWVVLSACNTASSDGLSAEAVPVWAVPSFCGDTGITGNQLAGRNRLRPPAND